MALGSQKDFVLQRPLFGGKGESEREREGVIFQSVTAH